MKVTKKAPETTPRPNKNAEIVRQDSKNISLYDHLGDNTPKTITFQAYLQGIRTGQWKEPVEAVRKGKKKKQTLSAVTVSGVFKGSHNQENLIERSFIMAIDVDAKDNPQGINYSALLEDEGLLGVHKSAGGEGVVAYIVYEGSHIGAFNSIKKHMEDTHGLKVDEACKNINRLRFVSYDPNMPPLNEEALVWNCSVSHHVKYNRGEVEYLVPSDDDIEAVKTRVEWAIENDKPVFETNEEYWNYLMVALSQYDDVFREYVRQMVELWDRLNSDNPNEPFEEEWERAKGYGPKDDGVGIGSFIHAFKKAGYNAPQKIVRLGKNKAKTVKSILRNAEAMDKALQRATTKEAVIDNVVHRGEATFFAGPNGVGKSPIATKWAFDVAKSSPVLFLDFELSSTQWRTRYPHWRSPKFWYSIHSEDFRGEPQDVFSVIKEAIEEIIEKEGRPPALVVVDNFTALAAANDVTRSNEAVKVVAEITKLKFTYPQSGFLILTHVVKSQTTRMNNGISADQMRGSGTLADLIDTMILVDRTCDSEDDNKYVYLKHAKFRSHVPGEDELWTEESCKLIQLYKREGALCISIKDSGHLESSLIKCNEGGLDAGCEDRVRAEIVRRLKDNGYTHEKIADIIGYTTASAVTKLLKRVKN